jgi:hypothetical protein
MAVQLAEAECVRPSPIEPANGDNNSASPMSNDARSLMGRHFVLRAIDRYLRSATRSRQVAGA